MRKAQLAIALPLAGFCLTSAAALPAQLGKALGQTGFSAQNVSLWAAEVNSGSAVISHRATESMSPASIMKTATLMCALETLGPGYTWKTRVRAKDRPNALGEIRNVSITGGGDPHLVAESIWKISESLSAAGVKTIRGNVRVDRSLFSATQENPNEFDGKGWRAYNVAPDAAMVSFKSASVRFVPDEKAGIARTELVPRLAGVTLTPSLPLSRGGCGDWKSQIRADIRNPRKLLFLGSYPLSCGIREFHASLFESDEYLERILRATLAGSGIAWDGKIVPGHADDSDVTLVNHASEPLSQLAVHTGKFSNNPMARHMFLTLSLSDARGDSLPATLERSREVFSNWLKRKGIPSGIVPDNGSGLSRKARVTAESFGKMLQSGFAGPYMPELLTALPIAGVDGTMKKRPLPVGSAHIKTGLLTGVNSVAGYVTAQNGRRYAVVGIINAPDTRGGKEFLDSFLAWVASGR